MADVHTKEIRSKNMAAIKGKDTKPEMRCGGSFGYSLFLQVSFIIFILRITLMMIQ